MTKTAHCEDLKTKGTAMKKHGIGWLNVPGFRPETWNPIVGCSKVSEGCGNCYAERMAFRLAMMSLKDHREPLESYRKAICNCKWTGQTYPIESVFQKPIGWKKPRAIFVNSMGDLFHENTPEEWIDQVFAVMSLCPQHLFIVLTKRAERMETYITGLTTVEGAIRFEGFHKNRWDMRLHKTSLTYRTGACLKNVWLGVTSENQAEADERIPHLLNTPAAVRFVSCEPLLGPIKLQASNDALGRPTLFGCLVPEPAVYKKNPKIDWIICGGESGPGARPMNPEWARSLRDQADGAGVPFFFKQLGDNLPSVLGQAEHGMDRCVKRGGDFLDGRQWHQWPSRCPDFETGEHVQRIKL